MNVSLFGKMLITIAGRVFGLTSLAKGRIESVDGNLVQFVLIDGCVDEGG
jgi:hypothetical protein